MAKNNLPKCGGNSNGHLQQQSNGQEIATPPSEFNKEDECENEVLSMNL